MTHEVSIPSRRRQGSIYMSVLAATMVVTLLGSGALMVARLQVRMTSSLRDTVEARRYAAAGVELGRHLISQDANWRSSRASGVWIAAQAIGGGTFSLSVVDPNDGNLGNAYGDSVVVTATGVKGMARAKLRVELTPVIKALSCLEVAACSQGGISLTSATLRSDQTISTNAGAAASGANLYAQVETITGATGGSYRGEKTILSSPRTLPQSSVFDWYVANGTSISIGSLQSSSKIEKALLSPGVNPYGTQVKNAKGVYFVNCGGANIEIKDSRIVGTLVLLNCGTCTISKAINWEPAQAGYPILIVQGKIALDHDTDELSESPNFNPSHTPYNGVANNTTGDSYPSILNGLIYATGNITLSTNATINGCVIAGGTLSSVGGNFEVNYSSASRLSPPPGFMMWPPTMSVVSGTRTWVVDP